MFTKLFKVFVVASVISLTFLGGTQWEKKVLSPARRKAGLDAAKARMTDQPKRPCSPCEERKKREEIKPASGGDRKVILIQGGRQPNNSCVTGSTLQAGYVENGFVMHGIPDSVVVQAAVSCVGPIGSTNKCPFVLEWSTWVWSDTLQGWDTTAAVSWGCISGAANCGPNGVINTTAVINGPGTNFAANNSYLVTGTLYGGTSTCPATPTDPMDPAAYVLRVFAFQFDVNALGDPDPPQQ